MKLKIVLFGSGNVATHLGLLLSQKHQIVQVYSKNKTNAQVLAKKIKALFTNNLSEIIKSDIFLLALDDQAIETVIKQIPHKEIPIAHTSGSVSIDAFISSGFINFGVFYPLQTFSKVLATPLEFPICIEASNINTQIQLNKLAQSIVSKKHCYFINSEERKWLHIAAIFANNFTNHMVNLSTRILYSNQINTDLIKPLIKQTFLKLQKELPENTQTGPAIRNNQKIISKHIQTLTKNNNEDLAILYKEISQSIYQCFLNNNSTKT